ncbi:hypothetical protein B0T11DRAFT_282646 [Plectosphaerella cucumerina]|uniref:NmrA-like domain-containing protein n=1 Tax=Plectosphaerella cucumerina TaxID=40658 RepID=A0A8K0TL32_9PEZI|nr:hypothetical protein B0T11DRAFT_282646 [Plectosphaerella cucumerina]
MLVLIAGITGNLGQQIASAALARGLQVRGLARNPDNLKPELRQGLESFVKTENYYDIPALERAVAGVDAIISAYSPSPLLDLDANLLLLRAAERAEVKIFVVSSWNNDWTKNKYGDMEVYDAHIAFEKQAALTSSIKPIYFFTGMFADLLLTPFGPGSFELVDGRGKMSYWGNGNTVKHPWSTTEDIAAWTIETLINGKGVQQGEGGFFRFSSGHITMEELAALYEKVTGIKTDIVNRGTLEDLEKELAEARRTKGRASFFEYLPLAAALLGAKGVWRMEEQDAVYHARAPTSLESWLKTQKK